MIGLFRQKSPANIILLLVFGVLIKWPMFMHPHIPAVAKNDGILYRGILEMLETAGRKAPLIYPLIAFILHFLQAVLFNRLVNYYRMMSRPNFLAGMCYMLVTSLFPEWNVLSPALLVSPVLILIFSILLKIHNEQRVAGTVFNMGLYIGIASLIFFPSVLFVIWCLFGLLIMRPLKLNEWVLCIVGVTVPYYFYSAWLLIAGGWSFNKLIPGVSFTLPAFNQSVWLAGSGILLAVLFLIGGYYIQDNLRRMLIQVRKGWSLILLWLLFALFVPFINAANGFETWVLAAIPFAGFHACAYFYMSPKWLSAVLFWISVAFILCYQYYQHGWG